MPKKTAEEMLGDVRAAVDGIGETVNARLDQFGNRLGNLEQAQRAGGVSVPGTGVDDPGKFSFARAIWAMRTGDWDDVAPYEKEVFAAARKKALAAGTGAGSDLVPTEVVGEIVELLRSRMIVDQLGVRRMSGLTGSPVQIPRQTAASTGYWVGENSTITASDSDDDLISLTPRKAAGLSPFSNTLLRAGIASGTIEQYVRQDLAEVLARTIQVGLLNGAGTLQPLGVLQTSGINTVDMSGVTDRAGLITALQAMINALEVDEVDIGNLKWVMHPLAFHKMSTLLISTDTGLPTLTAAPAGDARSSRDPGMLLGYPYLKTTDMPLETTPSDTDIILANWDDVILADWGSIELAISQEAGTSFADDQTWVRIIQEVDVDVRHPVSVCAGRDFVY